MKTEAKNLTLTLDKDFKEWLAKAAKLDNRSVTSLIKTAVEYYVETRLKSVSQKKDST